MALAPILRYKTADIAFASVAAGRELRHQAAVGGVDGFQYAVFMMTE